MRMPLHPQYSRAHSGIFVVSLRRLPPGFVCQRGRLRLIVDFPLRSPFQQFLVHVSMALSRVRWLMSLTAPLLHAVEPRGPIRLLQLRPCRSTRDCHCKLPDLRICYSSEAPTATLPYSTLGGFP